VRAPPLPAKPAERRSNAARLFGYDVFISFALGPPPRGSRSYASDLARRLRERDFTVFFSEEEAPAGDQLDGTLKRALHRSRILVVIANEGTLSSPHWVQTEVEEFRRVHPARPIIPINIGNALQDPILGPGAEQWLRHSGKIWIDELQSAADEGVVSDAVLERLATAPNALRARKRWRWTVRAAFAVLGVVTATALWFARSDRQNARLAVSRQEQAQKNAEEARLQAGLAKKNESEALRQKRVAEENARLADDRERVSRSRALAIQAREARGLPDTALLLGLAAIHAERTRDAESALLGALFTYPRLQANLFAWHDAATRIVTALTVSPDGRTVLAGYQDGALIYWQGTDTNGTYLRRPSGGWASTVDAVAFSSDGAYVSAATADATISSWHWKDKRTLPRIRLTDPLGMLPSTRSSPYFNALALAFDPRTGLLAAGQYDGRIRMWNVATASSVGSEFGSPIAAELNAHTIGVQSLAFSSDGTFLISGHGGALNGRDATMRVWLAADGFQPGRVLRTDTDGALGMAVEPGTHRIAFATQRAIRIENADGSEARSLSLAIRGDQGSLGSVIRLAFGEQDGILAAGMADGRVAMWRGLDASDKETPSPDVFASGESRYLGGIVFVPHRDLIATSGLDGVVRLWTTDREPAGALFGQMPPLYDTVFNSDGTMLAAVGVGGTVETWDVQRRKKVDEVSLGHNESGSAVAFVNASDVAVLTQSGRLLRCGRSTCTEVNRPGPRRQSGARAFGPAGAFWLEWLDRPFRCTTAQCQALPGPRETSFHSSTMSPDGLRWTVSGWNVDRAPGGVVSFCQSSGCRLLDVGSGGGATSVSGTRFNQAGSVLAVGMGDGRVIFFNGRDGTRLGPPSSGQLGGIEHLAFSPDGTLMASAGREGSVLLWDVATRQPLGVPLPGPGLEQVRAMLFHPKGRTLFVQYSDGRLIELRVDIASHWEARACHIANRDLSLAEHTRYGMTSAHESVCPSAVHPPASWEPRPPAPF
jgi:WD40 repeat protein